MIVHYMVGLTCDPMHEWRSFYLCCLCYMVESSEGYVFMIGSFLNKSLSCCQLLDVLYKCPSSPHHLMYSNSTICIRLVFQSFKSIYLLSFEILRSYSESKSLDILSKWYDLSILKLNTYNFNFIYLKRTHINYI